MRDSYGVYIHDERIVDFITERYSIGSLCVTAPKAPPNWEGYWIVIHIEKSSRVNKNITLVSLNHIDRGLRITLPYDKVYSLFVCIT